MGSTACKKIAGLTTKRKAPLHVATWVGCSEWDARIVQTRFHPGLFLHLTVACTRAFLHLQNLLVPQLIWPHKKGESLFCVRLAIKRSRAWAAASCRMREICSCLHKAPSVPRAPAGSAGRRPDRKWVTQGPRATSASDAVQSNGSVVVLAPERNTHGAPRMTWTLEITLSVCVNGCQKYDFSQRDSWLFTKDRVLN